MKKLSIIMLFLLLLTTGCSGGKKDDTKPNNTKPPKTNTENKDDTNSDSAMNFKEVFTNLEMKVSLNKETYKPKEIVHLTASVKNTSDNPIKYLVPTTTENMHKEIAVSIYNEDKTMFFTDIDTFGKTATTDVKEVELKPGEEYSQEMKFEPYYIDPEDTTQEKKYFEPGVYEGKAVFNIIVGEESVKSEAQKLLFKVTIK